MSDQRAHLLAFFVLGRGFVVDVMRVVELVRGMAVVPLPQGAPWVEGNMVLRGRVIPVLSLAYLVNQNASEATSRGQSGDLALRSRTVPAVVVVRVGRHILGLSVERIAEVLRPPMEALMPDNSVAPHRSALSLGLCTFREQTYTLLDLRPLVSLHA